MTVHELAGYAPWAKLAADRAAYRRAKERAVASAVRRAERLFPGLGDRTVTQDAASPLTYERYTGNRAGASAGWSWDPAHKPIKGGKGPIAGLVTIGHWAYAPGGIPTALITGYMVGQSL